MTFVEMRAPAQDKNRRATEFSDEEFARMSGDAGFGKAWDFCVRNTRRDNEIPQHVMETAAEHQAERGPEWGTGLDTSDGALHGVIKP